MACKVHEAPETLSGNLDGELMRDAKKHLFPGQGLLVEEEERWRPSSFVSTGRTFKVTSSAD